MDNGDIALTYNPETNKMEFAGTYELGGETHEFNVENPNQFPGVVTKVDDPSNLLLNTNLEINKLLKDASVQEGDGSIVRTGTSWEDPAVQQRYNAVIAEQVADENTLLSLATDYYGYDPEEARMRLADGTLKTEVANIMKFQAQEQFFGNEQQRISAAHTLNRQNVADERSAIQFEQQQADRARALEGGAPGAGLTPNKAFDVAADQAEKQQTYNIIQTAITPNADGELTQLEGLIGKGNITGAEYDSNFIGTGGTVKISVKGIDEPIEFETSNGVLPPKALQFIFNQTGLGQAQQANPLGLNL